MNEHKQVYWDSEKNQFYWIEWIETGNNDIPIKHYIKMRTPSMGGSVSASEDRKDRV